MSRVSYVVYVSYVSCVSHVACPCALPLTLSALLSLCCPACYPACIIPSCAQVVGASNISAIACGAFHNMALTAGGEVLTWGTNDYGQLGNGHTGYCVTPARVPGMDHVLVSQRRSGLVKVPLVVPREGRCMQV